MNLQTKLMRAIVASMLLTLMLVFHYNDTMASDVTERMNIEESTSYSGTVGVTSEISKNLSTLSRTASIAQNKIASVSSNNAEVRDITPEPSATSDVEQVKDKVIGTVYVQRSYLNFRKQSNKKSKVIDVLSPGTKLKLIEKLDNGWYKVKYKSEIGYVYSDYVGKKQYSEFDDYYKSYSGERLNSVNGIVSGPSGNETYYNLNMSGCIKYMKDLGYDYKYWVRSDGVKMYGDYVMCAADLSIRPKGTIVKTSLGLAMVCDTGTFVNWDSTRLDIAVAW